MRITTVPGLTDDSKRLVETVQCSDQKLRDFTATSCCKIAQFLVASRLATLVSAPTSPNGWSRCAMFGVVFTGHTMNLRHASASARMQRMTIRPVVATSRKKIPSK